MKLTRADLRLLTLPIALAAALVVLGVACVVSSDYYLTQAKNERETARAQRAEAQKRVEQVSEEERELKRNLVLYQDMSARGMVNEESRLDIIDAIARIKAERKLFDIRYQIDPQKPLDYPGMRPAGPLDLVASRMKLEMLVLHEGDLLGFLDDLDRSGKAYISVRGCAISRADQTSTPPFAISPRLRSSCQVDLVALKRGKAS